MTDVNFPGLVDMVGWLFILTGAIVAPAWRWYRKGQHRA